MSASSKKKLRNAEQAEKLTERQLAEQAEAKKLKTYTTLFTVVLVAIVVIAVVAGANQFITNSGIREKNTVAVNLTAAADSAEAAPIVMGDQAISNAELNYYFIDAVQNFVNQYGSYVSLFGLDTATPLNEQVTNEETGATWADDFLEEAKSNAAATYALVEAAKAAGHTLTEEEQATLDANLSTMEAQALIYGYSDLDTYLKAMYGKGASEKSFTEYIEINTLASSYYNAYSAALTYDAAALQTAYDAAPAEYTAYSYNSYYISASSYREGGTEGEDGTVTYSDEEKAAAVAAAEADAKALTSGEISTVAELDKAIAELAINADSESAPTSTAYSDYAYDSVNSVIRDWVTSTERKEGDLACIPNTSTSTDEEGNETTTTNGYYVILFASRNDNTFALKNARHILVSFEGGTYDSTTGSTTYSDDEKAAAKASAEELLAQWQSGDATEESFAVLANEKSSDGDGTTGGLYEDIYPGQMVTNFNDWVYENGRKAGDTGIVETQYGYHVMYFVGDSETNYRDYLIEQDLRTADLSEWYTALTSSVEVTENDTPYISKDLTLSNG